MDEAHSFVNDLVNGITELYDRREDFAQLSWPFGDENFNEIMRVFDNLKKLEQDVGRVLDKMTRQIDDREEFLERRGHALLS